MVTPCSGGFLVSSGFGLGSSSGSRSGSGSSIGTGSWPGSGGKGFGMSSGFGLRGSGIARPPLEPNNSHRVESVPRKALSRGIGRSGEEGRNGAVASVGGRDTVLKQKRHTLPIRPTGDIPMLHGKITLDGHGKRGFGNVVTQDGEVIGTWSADESDFYSFTPNGEEEAVIGSYFFGMFCSDVADWHEAK